MLAFACNGLILPLKCVSESSNRRSRRIAKGQSMTTAMRHINAAIAAVLAGGLVGLAALPAAAAETFVCDDGRVLTLTQEQVSVMVNTDPCIAKYYGREISVAPAAETRPAVPADLPLPTRKPEEIAAQLRELPVNPTAPAAVRKPVAIADVPSDFRNVHIINSGEGAPQYYKHTR